MNRSVWLSRTVLIAGLVLFFGIIGMVLCPPETFFSCDGGSKYILTRAFLTRDANWPMLPYPGRALDPEGRFFPIREVFSVNAGEQYYSTFPIYFPMLSAPGLALMGMRGLHLLPLLAGACCLILFALLGDRIGWTRRWTLGGIALLAFATPFGFYTAAFWEHVPALAVVLAGIVLFFARTGTWSTVAAGFLLGFSAILRVECPWVGAGLLGAGVIAQLQAGRTGTSILGPHGKRRLVLLAAGLAAGGATVAGANLFVYGTPIGTHLFANMSGPEVRRTFIFWRLIAGKISPFWTIPALGLLASGLIPGRWGKLIRLALLVVIALPVSRMLLTQTLPPFGRRSLQGILETSPFFFLIPLLHDRRPRSGTDAAFPEQSEAGRQERASRFAVLLGRAAAIAALGMLLSAPVEGGLQGGGRLLLPVVVVGLAAVLSDLSGPRRTGFAGDWTRWALIGALLVSVPLSSRSLDFLVWRAKEADHPAIERIRKLPGDALLFTNSYFPQGIAALYWERPFYQPGTVAGFEEVLRRLGASGGKGFLLVTQPERTTPPAIPIPGEKPIWIRKDEIRMTAYLIGVYRRSD